MQSPIVIHSVEERENMQAIALALGAAVLDMLIRFEVPVDAVATVSSIGGAIIAAVREYDRRVQDEARG